MNGSKSLLQLRNTIPQQGVVEWIGVRAKKREPLTELSAVNALTGKGLDGDHYSARNGKREVTLIQAEHLAVIASLLHIEKVQPQQLRRNIVVSGISLLALKEKQFAIGEAIFEMTGLCHPCSRMEQIFGSGGYNAVRGHGGITARVITAGCIKLGDSVKAILP